MYKFFTEPSLKGIYSDIDFKKHYEAYCSASFLTFEDDQKALDNLCMALVRTLKENNINLLYKIKDNPTIRVELLSIEDKKDLLEIFERNVFIFSNDYVFLFEFGLNVEEDAMVFYGSQKIISDLRGNYPESWIRIS